MKSFIYSLFNYKLLFSIFLLIVLLFIGITIIIPIDLLVNNIGLERLEEASNIINTNSKSTNIDSLKNTNKISIFNPFIDIFDKCSSTYKHVPSYFMPSHSSSSRINISTSSSCIIDSQIIKAVIDEQIYRLQQINNNWAQLYDDLSKIITEYHENLPK
jgi:hypothetical protein